MIEIDSWKRNSWRSSRPWLPCCIILSNPCLPNPSLLNVTDCHCLDTTHIKREWWGWQSFTQKIPMQENVSRLLLPKLSLGADRQQLSPEPSAGFHSNFSFAFSLLPRFNLILTFGMKALSCCFEWTRVLMHSPYFDDRSSSSSFRLASTVPPTPQLSTPTLNTDLTAPTRVSPISLIN